MKETSKVTLTLGQLRRLVAEAADQTPTTKMNDNIIRLDGCKLQQALCWGFNGFVIVHKKLNSSFSKRLPYINIIYQDNVDNPNWQIHFLNFEGGKVDRGMVDEMLKCVADTCKENKIDIYSWNSTPGGISGISRLSRFGMVKKYLPVKKGDNRYWGGHIDKTKLTDWLTSGKHDEDFLVRTDNGDFISPKDYNGEIDGSNTVPRPFVMVAESIKAEGIEVSSDKFDVLLENPTKFDGSKDEQAFLDTFYYSKEFGFAWKLVYDRARHRANLHAYKPDLIKVLGQKRFGWREYVVSQDHKTIKQVGFRDFQSKEEAGAAFKELLANE